MIKWLKSNAAKHIVFADIADVSMEQCKERYMKVVDDKMRKPQQFRHRNEKPFSAEFITADCTKVGKEEGDRQCLISCNVSINSTKG